MAIEGSEELKPEPKPVVVKNDARPLFRIVIEYQPETEATDMDMEAYMAAVMGAVKSIQAPHIALIRATIERED